MYHPNVICSSDGIEWKNSKTIYRGKWKLLEMVSNMQKSSSLNFFNGVLMPTHHVLSNLVKYQFLLIFGPTRELIRIDLQLKGLILQQNMNTVLKKPEIVNVSMLRLSVMVYTTVILDRSIYRYQYKFRSISFLRNIMFSNR